ncbi:MAG: hypothetical protein V3T39_02605 [Gammaproteobacteria bacterium]
MNHVEGRAGKGGNTSIPKKALLVCAARESIQELAIRPMKPAASIDALELAPLSLSSLGASGDFTLDL